MEQIRISIISAQQDVRAQAAGTDAVSLVYKAAYEPGDCIVIHADVYPAFYWVKIDDTIERSMVYLTGDMQYEIPFEERKCNLSPKAFTGQRHWIHVRRAYPFEWAGYRNLAYNPNDQHGQTHSFPHATANVETRGESVFAAMNAIDGVVVPESHGKWPYQSWGINQRPDAAWKLDFGRSVCIDRVIVHLRADFPHDNWWERARLTLSDGTEMVLELEKGGHAQEFMFPSREVSWLSLSELEKADDPSPFPALTQVEVYGIEG